MMINQVMLLALVLASVCTSYGFYAKVVRNHAFSFALSAKTEANDIDINDWVGNPDLWSVEREEGADPRLHVEDVATFDKCMEEMDLKYDFVVNGNTSHTNEHHPVVGAVIDRWKARSLPGSRDGKDKNKIALAIEGGGMRGCVAAGATAAIHYLGLADTIDIVYGSSAGAMIGSYFVTKQTGGIPIYHDLLPSAGKRFIDKKKLILSAAVPSAISLDRSRYDVFNLDFLLGEVMSTLQPLDVDYFLEAQQRQPMKIVASSIRTFEPYVMSYQGGHFHNLPSLLDCIRASMGVPGITGGMMAINAEIPSATPQQKQSIDSENIENIGKSSHHPYAVRERKSIKDLYRRKRLKGKPKPKSKYVTEEINPLVDALVCEPIPYRSAIIDGATHVIVLRTRPDPSPILGKPPGIYEKLIGRKYFKRHKEYEAIDWIMKSKHHQIYAEDLVRLNEASMGPKEGIKVGSNDGVHLLPVAPTAGNEEVGQLEMSRGKLMTGMRDGALRILDIFLPAILNAEKDEEDEVIVINRDEMNILKMSILDTLFPLESESKIKLRQYRDTKNEQVPYN